jgi:hypothetical protein
MAQGGAPRGSPPRASGGTELIVLLVGVLLVALGVVWGAATGPVGGGQASTANEVVSGVLLALGGGVLGAGLNSFIVRRYEFDALDEIKELVASSLAARFVSTDDQLAHYRRLWHHYYLTELENEQVWWYETCRFGDGSAVGSLSQRTTLRDSAGLLHSYTAEVGVRGQRMILINSREDGTEASGVEVFPMPRGFQQTHAGFGCIETWDGTQILTKVLLSTGALVDAGDEGKLAKDLGAQLDSLWTTNFFRHTRTTIVGP